MTDRVEVVVLGAGVVGLAVARALALAGREVIVVERNAAAGEETSARNSGVIHSGIYYPAGSLKAELCVRGRELLYAYCDARGIAHRRCGKLIVGQSGQLARLEALRDKGRANGVDDLQWLEPVDVRALEPEVRCAAALWCPSTGIIDVHDYLASLAADIEAAGGAIVTRSVVESVTPRGRGFALTIDSGGRRDEVECDVLVNAGGLAAIAIAASIAGYPACLHRPTVLAKGNYFALRGASPFSHLVYPLPNEAGLGIHATLDLDGRVRFGPDVEWVNEISYHVDARRADSFYDAIREYWPSLAAGTLAPDYAGIRPKLVGAGAAAADFLIEGTATHGLDGLINLLGIESPGLTASLALAERVAAMLGAAGAGPARLL